MDSEKKKILIVAVILLLLVFGIIAVRRGRPSPTEETSSEEAIPEETEKITSEENNIMTVSSEKSSYQTDEIIPVNISFKASGKKIFGSDIVLLYDPEFLSTQPEDITFGDFFVSFPRNTVDPKNGIIKISAYQGQDIELSDQYYNIVNIKFRAVKKGVTDLSLSWVSGATNTTNLVENGTSQNILKDVKNLKITIE